MFRSQQAALVLIVAVIATTIMYSSSASAAVRRFDPSRFTHAPTATTTLPSFLRRFAQVRQNQQGKASARLTFMAKMSGAFSV